MSTTSAIKPHPEQQIDFIGIGAIKSGSTWVAQCLAEHPQINFTEETSAKELHYFISKDNLIMNGVIRPRYVRGKAWYLDQFPANNSQKIRGEFCNSYLPDPVACQRIKQDFPQIKLIVILRNPVRMLYSLYWWFRGSVLREVPSTFTEFIRTTDYKQLGLYARQIKIYLDAFPREQLLILLLDDVKTQPEPTVKRLYQYLEVNDSFIPTVLNQKVNQAIEHRWPWLKDLAKQAIVLFQRLHLMPIYHWLSENKQLWELYKKINLKPAKYPPMKQTDRQYLEQYYQADVRQLEQLLDRDLKSLWGF